MLDSSFMEADDTRKPYWLFPSDATTHQKEGLREQNTDKPGRFFRKDKLDQHALKDLKHRSRPLPMLPGSDFIKPGSGVNPGRWVVADDEAAYLVRGHREYVDSVRFWSCWMAKSASLEQANRARGEAESGGGTASKVCSAVIGRDPCLLQDFAWRRASLGMNTVQHFLPILNIAAVRLGYRHGH